MNKHLFENTRAFAKELDRQDPLQAFRDRFFIPQFDGKDCLYFTGNSLGLQTKNTAVYVQQELDDWAQLGVEGHFQARQPWMPYHEILSKALASIVGANEEEVVAMNQLTVNLHLLMVSFYQPDAKRYKIICEEKAFPSDQYALESQARFHGFHPTDVIIEVKPRTGEHVLRTEDILATIERHGESVALVLFGGVNYYSGQFFDLPAITKAAHKVGAYCGFDLAHAAGNVLLQLHDWQVDFACWCSYKYLNSGPGGVAGVFIHGKHISDTRLPRFAGWWGHSKSTRFKMEAGFNPIPTAEGWQLSNAPIFSMAAHKASLDIFMEAGMDRIFEKAKLLSAWTWFVLEDINGGGRKKILEVITPSDPAARGCQLSILMMENGKKIFDGLSDAGIITDWREPNVIRIAPVALYNKFEEVWELGNTLKEMIGKF